MMRVMISQGHFYIFFEKNLINIITTDAGFENTDMIRVEKS